MIKTETFLSRPTDQDYFFVLEVPQDEDFRNQYCLAGGVYH